MTLRARYPPLSLSEQNALYRREDEQVMTIEPSNATSEEHSPMIEEVMIVELSNTTSEEHIPKIQVEQPIEKENELDPETPEAKKGRKKENGKKKKEKDVVDWDLLRKQYSQGMSRERTEHNADTVNWEAVRQASEEELASVILDRGMNNQLAGRIKVLIRVSLQISCRVIFMFCSQNSILQRFLDRMVKDHGSLDLEWLRYFPPLKAKYVHLASFS